MILERCICCPTLTLRVMTLTAGALKRVSSSTVDLAGRVVSSTDEDGLTTTYGYAEGGRTVTETLPGGGTRITARYRDGRTKSITGTAVAAEYHSYTVNADGSITETVHYGTENGARWSSSKTNGLGWLIEETRPSPAGNGQVITTTHSYNEKGQRILTQRTGQADEHFIYDADGRLAVHGFDSNDNGQLDIASQDPITVTTTGYEQIGTLWYEVTTTAQFLGETATQPQGISQISKRKIGGGMVEDIAITIDAEGHQTTTMTLAMPSAKTVVTTTSSDRASLAAVRTAINGLPVSETSFLSSTTATFVYDGLERLESVTDAAGITRKTLYADQADGTASMRPWKQQTRPPAAPDFTTDSISAYGTTGTALGRLETLTDSGGKTTIYTYDLRGQITRISGTASYPVAYAFNDFGQTTDQWTFRIAPTGDPAEWDLTSGDHTHWDFDEATGALETKTDAAGHSLGYTYEASGRLHTRALARGITTTYAYDLAGRLTTTTHSDGTTPTVTRTYWRNGILKTVSDAIGTHSYTPRVLHSDGLATWSLTGSTLLPAASIQEGYDAKDHRQSWALTVGGSVLHRVGYGYDAATGRLGSAALIGANGAATATWTYAFDPSTGQLSTLTAQNTTGPAITATRSYDARQRVQGISYSANNSPQLGWSYGFDPDYPQRRASARSTVDGLPGWKWGFNDRGEVTSAARTEFAGAEAEPAAVAGQSWGYTYDGIGNRSSMTRSAAAVRQADATLGPATSFTTSYTPNAVNQYAQIDPPHAIEVAGLTVPEVTQVSVNGAPTTGRPPGNGEPGGFSLWLEGAALGTWPQVSIQATRTGARANGSDLTTVRSGHVYVRPQELPTYDPDGNLLSDAGWQYEWDADNRLILAQQKEPGLPADMPQKRIKYHYDWMSRLVAREESERRTLNDGTGLRSDTWTLVKTTHHYYDGWNLMAEVESGATVSVAGSPSPKVRRYLHGLDLSNTHEVGLANGPRTSTTATGGVGTLLGVIAPDDRLYTACTEVNGNITGFIEASTGALAARFDYDAFGNVVTDWSAPNHNAAEITQLRFSTKLQDPETGWMFYGHRWYDPVDGRWTAKDPIAERGGLNLYAMVGNDAVNSVDVLGMAWNPADPSTWKLPAPELGFWLDGTPGQGRWMPKIGTYLADYGEFIFKDGNPLLALHPAAVIEGQVHIVVLEEWDGSRADQRAAQRKLANQLKERIPKGDFAWHHEAIVDINGKKGVKMVLVPKNLNAISHAGPASWKRASLALSKATKGVIAKGGIGKCVRLVGTVGFMINPVEAVAGPTTEMGDATISGAIERDIEGLYRAQSVMEYHQRLQTLKSMYQGSKWLEHLVPLIDKQLRILENAHYDPRLQ